MGSKLCNLMILEFFQCFQSFFQNFFWQASIFRRPGTHACKIRIVFWFGCYFCVIFSCSFCDLADTNLLRFSSSVDYIVLISSILNSERILMKCTEGEIIWGQKVIYASSTTFRNGPYGNTFFISAPTLQFQSSNLHLKST